MSSTHLFDGLSFINCVVTPLATTLAPGNRPDACSSVSNTPSKLFPTKQGDELTQALTERGGQVIEFPTLVVAATTGARAAEAQQHLNQLLAGDWLIFTSANAVRALSAFKLPVPATQLRVATVGEATQQAAEEFGFLVELIAPGGDGASLAQALLVQLEQHTPLQASIYFVRGETVASGFERLLFPYRERLKNVVVYASHRPAPPPALVSTVRERLRADLAQFPVETESMRSLYQVFTSGQSIKNYLSLIDDGQGITRIACEIPSCVIGKNTAEIAREMHMNVVVIPEFPSRRELIQTLEAVVFHERVLYSKEQ